MKRMVMAIFLLQSLFLGTSYSEETSNSPSRVESSSDAPHRSEGRKILKRSEHDRNISPPEHGEHGSTFPAAFVPVQKEKGISPKVIDLRKTPHGIAPGTVQVKKNENPTTKPTVTPTITRVPQLQPNTQIPIINTPTHTTSSGTPTVNRVKQTTPPNTQIPTITAPSHTTAPLQNPVVAPATKPATTPIYTR